MLVNITVPVSSRISPIRSYLYVGESLNLKCKGNKNLVWTHNDLPTGGNFEVLKNGEATLHSIQVFNKGVYACRGFITQEYRRMPFITTAEVNVISKSYYYTKPKFKIPFLGKIDNSGMICSRGYNVALCTITKPKIQKYYNFQITVFLIFVVLLNLHFHLTDDAA